ncbi:hypothetical protein OF83DRAFT_638205 [Amylostereum chailletii]|nr:hypothetical protein OF83DRAFT_638205 [Amylostereum chailletii]
MPIGLDAWDTYRLEGVDNIDAPFWTLDKNLSDQETQAILLLKSPIRAGRPKRASRRVRANSTAVGLKRKASGGALHEEAAPKRRDARDREPQDVQFSDVTVPSYAEYLHQATPRQLATFLPSEDEFNHLFSDALLTPAGPPSSEPYTALKATVVKGWFESRLVPFLSIVEPHSSAPVSSGLSPTVVAASTDGSAELSSSSSLVALVTTVDPSSSSQDSIADSVPSLSMACSSPSDPLPTSLPPSTELQDCFRIPYALTLASTVMQCADLCDEGMSRLYYGTELLAHGCKQRGYQTDSPQIRVNELAMAISRKILATISADPTTTTMDDIDVSGHRFVCASDAECKRISKSKYPTVYDFRGAVFHAVRNHKTSEVQFDLAGEEHTKSGQGLERKNRRGIYHRRCWSCAHCSQHQWSSYKRASSHVQVKHNVDLVV